MWGKWWNIQNFETFIVVIFWIIFTWFKSEKFSLEINNGYIFHVHSGFQALSSMKKCHQVQKIFLYERFSLSDEKNSVYSSKMEARVRSVIKQMVLNYNVVGRIVPLDSIHDAHSTSNKTCSLLKVKTIFPFGYWYGLVSICWYSFYHFEMLGTLPSTFGETWFSRKTSANE